MRWWILIALLIEEKLKRNAEQVLEDSRRKEILLRDAANQLAVSRVKKAMRGCRWTLL